jgi:hypothetical protein
MQNPSSTIHDYDPAKGMAFQGDVSIIPIPKKIKIDRSDEIAPIKMHGHPAYVPEIPFAVRVRDLLSYDAETGEFKWRKTVGGTAREGTVAGSVNSAGYTLIKVDGAKHQASRLAWLYVHGQWPEHYIDHINGNRVDNRLENLREATPAQNRHNSGPAKNSTSGIKGVFWNSKRNKWQARICLGGDVRQHLGYFHDLDAARDAYAAAELTHHQAFAASGRHLILAAGETTGHHHAIALLDRSADAIAPVKTSKAVQDLMADAQAGKIAVPTARLYRDPAAVESMRAAGIITRVDLAVAVLIVETGPMCLSHEEHDTIRIPPGEYLIGRQIESAGAEERIVAD